MLPGMAAKPRIAIVGAGNLGTALAVSLMHAGYQIEGIVARKSAKSSVRAKKLAQEIHAPLLFDLEGIGANLVWFCVPDSEIAHAAASVAAGFRAKGRIALHSSGALTSDELNPLRKKGAAVASVHPLMTFVRGSRPPLAGVSFAIEGDPKAIRIARQVVVDLGGNPYSIRKKDKAAYHAWGAFASPLFTSLLATSEEVAAIAGVDRKSARKRMMPILLQTLVNYAAFGPAGAFSGPIARGDVETVERHLRVLRRVPSAQRTYIALAHAALRCLPAKNRDELLSTLCCAQLERRK